MANKGAVVGIGLGAVALAAVIAFAKPAKANPKGAEAPPEDPYSPEACAAYKGERDALTSKINALEDQQADYQAAALEAEQNGDSVAAAGYASYANAIGASKNQAIAQRNTLNNLIAQCA